MSASAVLVLLLLCFPKAGEELGRIAMTVVLLPLLILAAVFDGAAEDEQAPLSEA